jgi:glycosyltransferase involved in cell wall biosynthesis
MRVLFSGLLLGQPMGGVRRHNAELLPRLARALSARGDELVILTGREPPAFALPVGSSVLPSRVPSRPVLLRAMHEGRFLRMVLGSEAAAGRPFDLVHTAHLPAPRVRGVPYSLTLHDLKILDLQHTPMSRRLIGQKIVGEGARGAAVVIAVSEALREELLSRWRIDPERVVVVRNGADHLGLLPRAADAARGSLLYVGHLEPRKNVSLLVRALAQDRELPPLELAGESAGEEGERLRALASELGVSDRVRFLGLQSDEELARLYAAAACFVMPSRREGFCIPVAEAQRAGVPVCVARTPVLLETSGNAPSFDPDDPAECARAIRECLSTPAHELEARASSAASLTWDAAAAALLAAWDAGVAGMERSARSRR